MLLMAHLSLVGTDLACAKHGVAKAPDAHAAHSTARHHVSHSGRGASQQQDDCETPATPDCCSAVTSCAPTIAIGEVTSVDQTPLVDASRPVGTATAPLSRVVAPETPPPKA